MFFIKIRALGLYLLAFQLFVFTNCSSKDDSQRDKENQTEGESQAAYDSIQPAIISTIPADFQTNVSTFPKISVIFSKPMDPGTISANTADDKCVGSFMVSGNNFKTCIKMKSTSEYSGDQTIFSVSPLDGLEEMKTYFIKITKDAKDKRGVSLEAPHTSLGFDTIDSNNSNELNLEAIIAKSHSQIELSFSGEANSGALNPDNFCIAFASESNCAKKALNIKSISQPDKRTIILNTEEMAPGEDYMIYISNLTDNIYTAGFRGYEFASLIITEVYIDDNSDAIEFIATRDGRLAGTKIYIKNSLRYTFPEAGEFSKGDIIVFHAQKNGADEINQDSSESVDPGNTEGYDFYAPSARSIVSTDGEIEIIDSGGNTLDFIAYSDGLFGTYQRERVQKHVDSGHWIIMAENLSEYDLIHSVKDNGANLCLQRIKDIESGDFPDTHSKRGWVAGTCGIGVNQEIIIPEFIIQKAESVSLTGLKISFNRSPDIFSLLDISNYCVAEEGTDSCQGPLLPVQGITEIDGNTITLETGEQVSGKGYIIFAEKIYAEGDESPLIINRAPFIGNPIQVSSLNPGDILITEINFDTDSALGMEGNTETLCNETDDEFMEIYNNSPYYVSLNGATIQTGSSSGNFTKKFTFGNIGLAPGEFLAVVSRDAGCFSRESLSGKKILFKGSGFSFSASGATFALVARNIDLPDAQSGPEINPGPEMVLDYIGTETRSAVYEGTGRAPDCEDLSLIRTIPDLDTDNNANDFTCGIPNGSPGY